MSQIGPCFFVAYFYFKSLSSFFNFLISSLSFLFSSSFFSSSVSAFTLASVVLDITVFIVFKVVCNVALLISADFTLASSSKFLFLRVAISSSKLLTDLFSSSNLDI